LLLGQPKQPPPPPHPLAKVEIDLVAHCRAPPFLEVVNASAVSARLSANGASGVPPLRSPTPRP
jgi:hypothetical protein